MDHNSLDAAVEVALYHLTEAPELVTQALRLQPTATQRRGDRAVAIGGMRVAANGWFLATDDLVESMQLADHLQVAITMLGPVVMNLRALLASGWFGRITLFQPAAEEGTLEIELPPWQLQEIASLGLSLCIFSYSRRSG